MNYKYLSKYHYIYRLYFMSSGQSVFEKIPIVYSNKHYVYVKEPGTYDLKSLRLENDSPYISGDIRTEFTSEMTEKIKNRAARNFSEGYGSPKWWFLLDDISPLKEWAGSVKFDFEKINLENEIKRCEVRKERALNEYKKASAELTEYELKLRNREANK